MKDDVLRVLWLTGPPGVGKTTVAWEIFSQLAEAGTEAAYVDIDQLGICHPDPPLDPGRHLIKAGNLGAVLANFQAAGARCVIVSGVIDGDKGVYADLTAHAAVAICRLRADREELRGRLVARGVGAGAIDEVLREADALDLSEVADVSVDTTGLSVEQVVRRVRGLSREWDSLSVPARRPRATERPRPAPPSSETRVLWLYGATGVGKSTVGFELHRSAIRAGRRAAYIDLAQVGICRPAPPEDPRNHRLKARNAAALWRAYRAVGVQCLVLAGPVETRSVVNEYVAGLESPGLTLCRLHAGAEQLRKRVLRRGEGGTWPEPGDRLKGQPPAMLAQTAQDAAAESDALDRAGFGGPRIATDGLTVEQTVEAVIAAVGWP